MLTILQTLAQTSSSLDGYSYTTSSTGGDAASAGMAIGLMLGIFVFILFMYLIFGFITMKIFKKAGRQDAWAAFVPIYNNYVYFEVAGRPGWWAFLAFIPFAGSIIAFVTMILGSIDMAKSFGKETGFGILLVLVPFVGLPMLAFGDATYQGPAGPEGGNQAPQAPNVPTMTPPQPPVQPPTQPLV